MPLPKVGPQDDPNIQIDARSIEQIAIAGEVALNERLKTIFTDSPWVVTAELDGNGSYTYYFRSKTGDTRPVILLTNDKPPLLLRSGTADQDVLLIPLPDNSWTTADYDENNRLIYFEDHPDVEGSNCELPGYLAIGLKDTVGDQTIKMTPYSAYGVGLHVQHGGHRYLPVSLLIDVRCNEVAKGSRKKIDIKIDPETSAFMLNGRLVFDLSGSTNPSLYFTLFKKELPEYIHIFTRVAEDHYMDQMCGRWQTRSRDCERKIYKELREKNPQAKLGLTFYLGDEKIDFDMPFDLCKVTSCDTIDDYHDNVKAAQSVLAPLIREIEKKIDTLTTGTGKEAPAGPDFPVEMPVDLLELGLFQSPYGQNVAGRMFQDVCLSIESDESDPKCLSATDRKKVIDGSLEKGLPLFLSISLAPDEERSIDPSPINRATTIQGLLNEGSTDREVEDSIRAMFTIHLSDRTDNIYERLVSLCKDKERDRSASGASASLLGAWALKGDAKARHILLDLLNDSLNISSEEAKTVVARTLALIIDDEEASAILNRIKSKPDAQINSMLLSALAGHEEFFEGFKILLDSYHPRSYETGQAPSIVEAMGRVFIDPILQAGDLKLELTPDQQKVLSGNNWPNDLLQRVHEELVLSQKISTDETAYALFPLIELMQGYAAYSIPREMVEKNELDVNTDLTKRHIYPGLKQRDIIRCGVQLARTAGHEEAYLSIEPKDDDKAKPVAIEIGVFETDGSTSVPRLSQAEIDKFLQTAKVAPNNEFTITHWHIHPIGRTNRHRLTDNIPSDADLRSYLYFTKEWQKKAPNANVEFRILTPYGVLFLKPKEAFTVAADRNASIYIKFVGRYQSAIQDSGGQISTPRLKILLKDYFEVEFETIKL